MASSLQATENNFREIEHEFGMLDAAGLAELLRVEGDPGEFAANLRKQGKILSFARLDEFVYPRFQFNLVNGHVKSVIAPLIELGRTFGWTAPEIASWLCCGNGYLPDYGRPVDVIDDDGLVLQVAQNEWGVVW
ncbi:hypothetical protein [Homoserinimonas sp. OAct 916]|uniref:hypothetical protein n=1 Tax=Homoserinimonas sp. OAct 916 TaxID=2211450 RepID=UPI001E327DFC|nr:hypothetical protein [Homoserinimonas sp. OAct 916]